MTHTAPTTCASISTSGPYLCRATLLVVMVQPRAMRMSTLTKTRKPTTSKHLCARTRVSEKAERGRGRGREGERPRERERAKHKPHGTRDSETDRDRQRQTETERETEPETWRR
eukprot:3556562-Rhodomonas_salina.2